MSSYQEPNDLNSYEDAFEVKKVERDTDRDLEDARDEAEVLKAIKNRHATAMKDIGLALMPESFKTIMEGL